VTPSAYIAIQFGVFAP